jgi:putative acetyltransferase
VNTTIRPERPDEYDAVRAVNLSAFDNPTEADLVDAMRATPQHLPELSLVAEVDGQIVGHAYFCEVVVEREDGEITALSLGPIAVRPAWQRKGIGGALIREGQERGRERGYPFIVLNGHPWYYPRFGFVPARQYGLETIWPVSDPVFMVCELQPGALEKAAGQLRYPEPFTRLP